MITIHDLLSPIRELQEEVRRAVVDACERASLDEMSGIAAEEEGDTIYAIDRVSEDTLVDFFSREVAPRAALVLIAEGIEGGRVVLPRGTHEDDARWRIIVDPIDGTRAIMYQKRSAWVLTGVAPNRGPRHAPARHRARGSDRDPDSSSSTSATCCGPCAARAHTPSA